MLYFLAQFHVYLSKCNSFLLFLFVCVSDHRKHNSQGLQSLLKSTSHWVDPAIWRDGFVCERQINKSCYNFALWSPVKAQADYKQGYYPGPANTGRVMQHTDICRLCREYHVLYFVSLINCNINFFLFLIFNFCYLEKLFF